MGKIVECGSLDVWRDREFLVILSGIDGICWPVYISCYLSTTLANGGATVFQLLLVVSPTRPNHWIVHGRGGVVFYRVGETLGKKDLRHCGRGLGRIFLFRILRKAYDGVVETGTANGVGDDGWESHLDGPEFGDKPHQSWTVPSFLRFLPSRLRLTR